MRILSYFFIIFLTPAIVLLNFRLLFFDHNFYQKEFTKLGVYDQIDKNTADNQSKKLINYFCCSEEIDSVFFTQRELEHLKDVKSLIRLANYKLYLDAALLALVIALLIYKKKYQYLSSALRFGSLAGIIAITTLGISATFNFDLLFVKFHQISFTNDLWQLPPEANLIKLFPQQFFVDFANRIAFQSLATLIAIYLITEFFLSFWSRVKRGDRIKHKI